MLKQIRKSIISLVIGCTILSGSQIEAFADHEHIKLPKTDVEKMIVIYEHTCIGDMTKEDEKMIRQYAKYKKLKKAGKDARKEHEKINKDNNEKNEVYQVSYYGGCCCECTDEQLRKIYPDMGGTRQERTKRENIILFVTNYYFNKEAKYKSEISYCLNNNHEPDHYQYITDKYAIMYGVPNCHLERRGPISTLTPAGAKAVIKREHHNKGNEIKSIVVTEKGNNYEIRVKGKKNNIGRDDFDDTIVINKNTRIIESVYDNINNKEEKWV